jgi:mannose-6-phosphate isomerase-like protein (cupin superfamily)
MATVTTGRTLVDGDPVSGTGFEVDPGGWLAEMITDRAGPVSSHPTEAVWAVPLEGDGDTIRTLSILGPGYDGPPEHYHERSEEVFDVREGTVTMTLDGTGHAVGAGEAATVETGVRHTFRNESGGRTVLITEVHSPGRLRAVFPTLGGLAHDPDRDADDPLQQAVIADRLDGNTVFTDAERPGADALAGLLAPVGRAAGYRGAYGKYMQPAFWRRHVEQPDF